MLSWRSLMPSAHAGQIRGRLSVGLVPFAIKLLRAFPLKSFSICRIFSAAIFYG